MKPKEILNLGIKEIEAKIYDNKELMRKHIFAHSISAIDNPMIIRKTRKTIARLKTILNQKNNITDINQNDKKS